MKNNIKLLFVITMTLIITVNSVSLMANATKTPVQTKKIHNKLTTPKGRGNLSFNINNLVNELIDSSKITMTIAQIDVEYRISIYMFILFV